MTVDEINYIYKSCATCGFQYGLLLLTTYIVPIAEGGTDTYSNKLGLCPNCSRMFNKGQMLVDETGKISLNLRHVEEAKRHNLAGSLDKIRSELYEYLSLPEDEKYHPSPENLKRTFQARR